MKLKKILLIATLIFSSILTQMPQANAWETGSFTTNSGDKQFIALTYFQSGTGTSHYKSPTGAHQTLSIICTGGRFNIAFSDISAQGIQNLIGAATLMEVQVPATGKIAIFNVNTKKGTQFVDVTKPKELYRKMKSGKDIHVKIFVDGKRAYEARFNTQELSKYASKFAAAGCKI